MAKFWYIPTIIYIVFILLGIGAAFLFRWFQNRRRKPGKRVTVVTGTDPSTSTTAHSPGTAPRSRAGADEIEMVPLRPSEQGPGTSGGATGTTPAASASATPPAPMPSTSTSTSVKKTKSKETNIKQA